jgi:transposase-like protein
LQNIQGTTSFEMALEYDIDDKIRFIVLYQDAQMKAARISKILGVSERTIYDWIHKIESDIDILEHQSWNGGAKTITSSVKKARLLKNTFFSDEMGIKLSELQPSEAWNHPTSNLPSPRIRGMSNSTVGQPFHTEGQLHYKYFRTTLTLKFIRALYKSIKAR